MGRNDHGTTKRRAPARVDPTAALFEAFGGDLPEITSLLMDGGGRPALSVRMGRDGTFWATFKRDGPNDTRLVCFGMGYDALYALKALERTVASGNWKTDKPYGAAAKGK